MASFIENVRAITRENFNQEFTRETEQEVERWILMAANKGYCSLQIILRSYQYRTAETPTYTTKVFFLSEHIKTIKIPLNLSLIQSYAKMKGFETTLKHKLIDDPSAQRHAVTRLTIQW